MRNAGSDAGSGDVEVEARLETAAARLRDVQRDAAQLALAGADPDAVRAQLRTCLVSTFCTKCLHTYRRSVHYIRRTHPLKHI